MAMTERRSGGRWRRDRLLRTVLPIWWWLLRRRYRIELRGTEALDRSGGLLILPNHPAYIDPVIVTLALSRHIRVRPVYERDMVDLPVLRLLPELFRSIPMPDLSKPSPKARQQTEVALGQVVEALDAGDNVILWPAGRAQRTGSESLRDTFGTAKILERAVAPKVVLLRTRGLWGSRLSYAFLGGPPRLVREVLRGIAAALGCLLMMPKREVTLTLEPLPESAWRGRSPADLNRELEALYNAPGPEAPRFVPLLPWVGPRQYEFPEPVSFESEIAPSDVPPMTRKHVAGILRRARPELEEAALEDPDTSLESLGIDSLTRMDLTLAIERDLGHPSRRVPVTLGDLWAQAGGLDGPSEKETGVPGGWGRDSSAPIDISGETVLEAFLHQVAKKPSAAAAIDDLSGLRTYEQLAVGAWAIARRLVDLEGSSVGILLPASVAADVSYLACLLAGKTPVMLNGTTGRANVQSAAETLGLRHAITGRAVLDHLGWDVEGVEWLELETMRKSITKLELLGGLIARRLRLGLFRDPEGRPDDIAMILFTSGSERAPKAVPLTHRNVLSDLRGLLEVFPLQDDAVVLSFLPPFHAFGINITSLLPLLAGARIVHHKDPTEFRALADKLIRYGVTVLPGTPTFVARILEALDGREAETLWLVVVGAEICPPSLARRLAEVAPRAELHEGYGTTECSPLVSCTRPDVNLSGTLGRPLPGVDVRVVDPDTLAPLDDGERGLLLVAGEIVFPGYLNAPSPFVTVESREWYATGDLVTRDASGTLRFCGRMKRFLKAGGEMISLPAIEGPLADRFPPTDTGPRVAVEGVEEEGRCRIVLFTTEELALDTVQGWLREAGLGPLSRIDAIEHLEEIPLLGTGKTDYRTLREQVVAMRR
ncbi:MAG: AMP-binding protein [Planctomycetota bacterium]